MHTHCHEVKLFLQDGVDLLPGGVRVMEGEDIQQQDSCVGTDMSIGHLEVREGGREREEGVSHGERW